jgi:hypothetical protein
LREAAPMIAELATDQAKDLALADLARLPKAELVRTTAQALEGTGWLPKPLRTPGVRDGSRQSAVGSRDELSDDGVIEIQTTDDGVQLSNEHGENVGPDEVVSNEAVSDEADKLDPAPTSELPPWLAAGEDADPDLGGSGAAASNDEAASLADQADARSEANDSSKPARTKRTKDTSMNRGIAAAWAKPAAKGKARAAKVTKAAKRKPRLPNGAASAI